MLEISVANCAVPRAPKFSVTVLTVVNIAAVIACCYRSSKVTQAAFADDLAGAGKLQQLLTWWNNIVEYGPLLGYNPRADKSWLVVKEHLLEEARVIFATSNVNITVEGHEYLGGFVGSTDG